MKKSNELPAVTQPVQQETAEILPELIDIPSADLIFPDTDPEIIYILPEVISPFRAVDIPEPVYFSFDSAAAHPRAALPAALSVPAASTAPTASASGQGSTSGALSASAPRSAPPAAFASGSASALASPVPGAASAASQALKTAQAAVSPAGPAAGRSTRKTESAAATGADSQSAAAHAATVPASAQLPAPVVPTAGQSLIYENTGVIEIVLDKPGWIFAGEKNGKRGIAFESRQVMNDKTLFKFRIMEEGDYKIVFQLQDMRGKADISEVNVKKSSSSPPEPENINSGYSKIIPEPAESGMLSENIFADAVSSADSGNYILAMELLEMIVKDNPSWPEMDKVYYLLGRYHEADTSRRSAAKSVYYYEKIIEDFPLSDYIHEAEDKIKYLRKHFIHIR